MNSQKYGVFDVFDLGVFDSNGHLVTVLNTLQDSFIDLNEGAFGVVYVRDGLLNKDLLEFVSKKEKNKQTDYDNILSGNKKRDTFVLNGNKVTKTCKLIAKCRYRNELTGEDHDVMYEIPEAELSNNYTFSHSGRSASVFDYVFEIIPFNENGDTVKVHIEK